MVTVRDLQYFVTFCDLISSHGWDSPDALTLDGARVLPFAAMALRVNLVTPAGWHATCFGQCPYSPYQEFCLHHAMNIFDKGFLKLRVPEKELHLKLCFVRFRMVLIEFPPTCRHRGCGELQTRAP